MKIDKLLGFSSFFFQEKSSQSRTVSIVRCNMQLPLEQMFTIASHKTNYYNCCLRNRWMDHILLMASSWINHFFYHLCTSIIIFVVVFLLQPTSLVAVFGSNWLASVEAKWLLCMCVWCLLRYIPILCAMSVWFIRFSFGRVLKKSHLPLFLSL